MGNNITDEEERDNLQDAMKRALGRNDMKEYHRLNGHLQKVAEKIRNRNMNNIKKGKA